MIDVSVAGWGIFLEYNTVLVLTDQAILFLIYDVLIILICGVTEWPNCNKAGKRWWRQRTHEISGKSSKSRGGQCVQ